jgi:hypothetical protein
LTAHASVRGLFARKSVAELQAEADSPVLRRALGPFELTVLGIGCTIGAGIFVLTGQAAAQYAGPAIVLSYLLASLRLPDDGAPPGHLGPAAALAGGGAGGVLPLRARGGPARSLARGGGAAAGVISGSAPGTWKGPAA